MNCVTNHEKYSDAIQERAVFEKTIQNMGFVNKKLKAPLRCILLYKCKRKYCISISGVISDNTSI